MKSGVKGLEKVKCPTIFSQIKAELAFLIKNWKVITFVYVAYGLFHIFRIINYLSICVREHTCTLKS